MPNWLNDAVFYEIYPQSFCDTNGDGIGDIEGIISKLDYVKNLGCNAIWLNPIYDSPFMDAGYDVRNYKKVAERYGTNDDLVRLFDEAHKKGIKILLDLVPGHTSDQHEWFLECKKAAKSEYSNRYIFTKSVWDAPPQYRMMCGLCERDGNYMVNYFSSQPALNYGFHEITHPEWQLPCDHPDCLATAEAMKDVMRFWLTHLLRTMTIKLQRQKSGVVCVICSTRNIRMPQWLQSGAIQKEQLTTQVSTWTSISTTTETATADFSATVNSAIRLFSILTARVISKHLQTNIFLTTKDKGQRLHQLYDKQPRHAESYGIS